MEIIGGTYEELVLGFKLEEKEGGYKLHQSFTDHSHVGCVRAAAVSSKGVLATGSSDESIKLFNLSKRSELGSLIHHEGSISSLEFFGSSHLFSGSVDGTIGVWKCNKWECIRTFKGHKGAVNSIAVHPTGKLALSVGVDKTLRLWNLITGKSAYVRNIKKVGDLVIWSPDGSKYLVLCMNQVDVYSVETAKVIDTIAYEKKVHCLRFVKSGELLAGLEDGTITVHDLEKKVKVGEFAAHSLRVKAMNCIHCEAKDRDFLVSVSSDTYVKVWELSIKEDTVDAQLVAEKETTFRLVCLTTWCKGGDGGGGAEVKQEVKEEAKEEQNSESESERQSESEDSEQDLEPQPKKKRQQKTSPAPPQDKLAKRFMKKKKKT